MRKNLLNALCWAMMSVAFVACSGEDAPNFNDDGTTIELPAKRAFVLNEGSWGGNNAGIAFYAPNKDAKESTHNFISDIYKMQNGKALGDLGQHMIEADEHMYVSVNASSLLVKLNSAGVEMDSISFTTEQGQPRYIAESDGKIYVTLWSHNVARIDAQTMTIEAMLPVDSHPEQIVEDDDKLYVISNGYGSGTVQTLSTIDIATFKIERKIDVYANPVALVEAGDKLFAISNGGASDGWSANKLQEIDKNGSVKEIGRASRMASNGDMLYYALSTTTDWTNYTTIFSSYNAKTGVKTDNFLKNVPVELAASNVYGISVDDESGEIYVCVSNFNTNGDIYRFDSTGSFVEKFDCGGINPNRVIFLD